MIWRWRQAILALALLAMAGDARAHEIGTTQVRFTVHKNHTWSAEITTPPDTAAQSPGGGGRPAAQQRARPELAQAKLHALRQDVARRIEVKFDGVASPVEVSLAWVGEFAIIQRPLAAILKAKWAGTGRRAKRHLALRPRPEHVCGSCSPPKAWKTAKRNGSRATRQVRPFRVLADIRPPTTPEIVVQYPRARFPPCRSGRPRPHPVCARHLPADDGIEAGPGASHLVYRRPFGYAWPDHVWHSVAVAADRRAADLVLDRVCGDRERLRRTIDALAASRGIRLRSGARHGFCRCAARVAGAAWPISSRAGQLQCRH